MSVYQMPAWSRRMCTDITSAYAALKRKRYIVTFSLSRRWRNSVATIWQALLRWERRCVSSGNEVVVSGVIRLGLCVSEPRSSLARQGFPTIHASLRTSKSISKKPAGAPPVQKEQAVTKKRTAKDVAWLLVHSTCQITVSCTLQSQTLNTGKIGITPFLHSVSHSVSQSALVPQECHRNPGGQG